MDYKFSHLKLTCLCIYLLVMGPKKKAQDDDDSTQKLARIYRKKCEEKGITPSKLFRQKIDQALQGDPPHMKKLMFWEEIGAVGTQVMFETFLEQGGYKHLQILILSNLKTYDEGLKYICEYMKTAKTIKQLELEINQITSVGCGYLGEALKPGYGVPILKLNLSYNKFGTAGLAELAKGLAQNPTIEQLFLNYCEIDENGAQYLQQILSYHQSKIETLSLIGNQLKNRGTYQLFRSLKANQALSELYLGNNQFGQSTQYDVIGSIEDALATNTTLIYLNLDGNGLYNSSAQRFIQLMENGSNPKLLIQFGVLANKQNMDKFKKLLKKRKKKKKKKKKKKGKKKK